MTHLPIIYLDKYIINHYIHNKSLYTHIYPEWEHSAMFAYSKYTQAENTVKKKKKIVWKAIADNVPFLLPEILS